MSSNQTVAERIQGLPGTWRDLPVATTLPGGQKLPVRSPERAGDPRDAIPLGQRIDPSLRPSLAA